MPSRFHSLRQRSSSVQKFSCSMSSTGVKPNNGKLGSMKDINQSLKKCVMKRSASFTSVKGSPGKAVRSLTASPRDKPYEKARPTSDRFSTAFKPLPEESQEDMLHFNVPVKGGLKLNYPSSPFGVFQRKVGLDSSSSASQKETRTKVEGAFTRFVVCRVSNALVEKERPHSVQALTN
mmetsp:Transcript_29261/g.75370  ORF Transcript_29261/g.75370 Transcript_29261/m.75370 type:complete len:178 (+) Transcript_29261:617-1150(+)